MMKNTIELSLLTYGIWEEIPSTWLDSSEENYKKAANLQYPNWKLAVSFSNTLFKDLDGLI
jgi:hypothetical protein